MSKEPRPSPGPRARAARRGRRGDRGSQFVEFGAYLPLFLLVVVLAFEVFAYFIAVERMHNAARAGVRVVGTQGMAAAQRTAEDALPWWMDDARVEIGSNDVNGYYAEVTMQLPIIFNTDDIDLEFTRRVEMPNV
jgi:hypothetical protein